MRSRGLQARGVGRAFTLAELVMVLAIIGILAAIAMPRLASGQSRYLVDNAARRIAADIDRARTQAVAGSGSVSMAFDVAANSYSIPGVESLDRRARSTSVQMSQEPYKARLVEVNFDGGTTLTWNGFGTASASGWIRVAVGTDQRLISVNQGTSVITIQRAAVSDDTGTGTGTGTGSDPGNDGTTGGNGPVGEIILNLLPGLLLPMSVDGGAW